MAAEVVKTSPVEVDKELFERFKSLRPAHGSWSWFVRAALERYVQLHETNEDELLDLAIKDLSNIKDS